MMTYTKDDNIYKRQRNTSQQNINKSINVEDMVPRNGRYQDSLLISLSLFFRQLYMKDPNLDVIFMSSFDKIKTNFISFAMVSKYIEVSLQLP